MEQNVDLLIQKLTKAIEANDKETILLISEEVDRIILNLLPDDKGAE